MFQLELLVLGIIIQVTFGQDLKDISNDPFIFQTDTLPENLRYMPSVGNGHLSTVIDTDTLYVNGIYNERTGWSHRARIPSIHASNISVTPAHATRTHMLDIKQGEYRETLSLPNYYEITYRVYAHQYLNRLLVTEVDIRRQGPANEGTAIVITRNTLTGNMSSIDIGFNAQTAYNGHVTCTDGTFTCSYRSGRTLVPETDTSGYIDVHTYWNDFPPTLTLPAGNQSDRWTYLFSVDQDQQVAENNFMEGMEFIRNQQNQNLLDNHMTEWQTIWDNGYIELEGPNLELQKVVYGCFYYLYSFLPAVNTYSPNNQFGGLSPGGLGNGANWTDYQGHVFWDMDVWMYPGILMFRPDLAREMLSYRVHGMDPAFERAASGGYSGTRFPWESGFTGAEVTPDICPDCRDFQQHITSDIALAARQYMFATRDVDWLLQKQAPLYNNYTGLDFVHNMAKFWFSRPTYSLAKDKYEVNGVMPPDEFAHHVNNTVYTNAGAMLSINLAKYAACLAGKEEELEYEVPERWFHVAHNLLFMYDKEERYHPEYEGYAYEINNDGTINFGEVKQADVVLLNFPYMMDIPSDVKRNDMEIYEALTDPFGPAMTWGIFCIGWLELDEADSQMNAERLLNKSYDLYMREPFKIWTEAQSGLGAINFITGMGGFLQTVLFGYGGLRLHPEEITSFRPNLPVGINKMSFKNVDYVGNKLDIQIDNQIAITLREVGSLPLTVNYGSGDYDLQKDNAVTFSLRNYRIFTKTPSNCPLPDDYIDVDYSQLVETSAAAKIGSNLSVSFGTILSLLLSSLK